jgi:hypothetical protein
LINVSCNGVPLIKGLDVYKEAGGSEKALTRTFHGIKPDENQKLRLVFTALKNNAMVNTISIDDESR